VNDLSVVTVAYGRPATEALADAIREAKAGHPLDPVTVVVASNIVGLAATAFGYIGPIVAALLHNVGSLIVIFNSARLVRKGEELEHFHPETIADKHDHGSHSKPAGELSPKLA